PTVGKAGPALAVVPASSVTEVITATEPSRARRIIEPRIPFMPSVKAIDAPRPKRKKPHVGAARKCVVSTAGEESPVRTRHVTWSRRSPALRQLDHFRRLVAPGVAGLLLGAAAGEHRQERLGHLGIVLVAGDLFQARH